MGRSYWYECDRCGYRAKVSGGPDRGRDFFVQTIACRDCKELYDAVTRLRVADESRLNYARPLTQQPKRLVPGAAQQTPPTFQAALNRLPFSGVRHFRWVKFRLQCPVTPHHRVQSWNAPNQCPRCGLYLEKNALPYRIWD